jgi:hypothetical protein
VSVASLFLLVAFNVFMVQGQFDLDRLAEERQFQQKKYEKLRDEVAALAAPPAIVSKAHELGMRDAEQTTFISAPVAGRVAPMPDRTVATQNDTRAIAKVALDPNP